MNDPWLQSLITEGASLLLSAVRNSSIKVKGFSTVFFYMQISETLFKSVTDKNHY